MPTLTRVSKEFSRALDAADNEVWRMNLRKYHPTMEAVVVHIHRNTQRRGCSGSLDSRCILSEDDVDRFLESNHAKKQLVSESRTGLSDDRIQPDVQENDSEDGTTYEWFTHTECHLIRGDMEPPKCDWRTYFKRRTILLQRATWEAFGLMPPIFHNSIDVLRQFRTDRPLNTGDENFLSSNPNSRIDDMYTFYLDIAPTFYTRESVLSILFQQASIHSENTRKIVLESKLPSKTSVLLPEHVDPTSSKLVLYVVHNHTGKQAILYMGQFLSFAPFTIDSDKLDMHAYMDEYPDCVCSTCGLSERGCNCIPAERGALCIRCQISVPHDELNVLDLLGSRILFQ